MYHANRHSGSTPDFWAETWHDIHFEASVQLCDVDPLRPLFEKYVRPEALILEGGCGKGHWVSWFADRGHKIVGLDFSKRTLSELEHDRPGLDLVAGNVNALPFADDTFDIYYSGGVVEHFEAGCEPALEEARRVIKPDGRLLLSVPYYSPLRKALTPLRRNEWRNVGQPEVDDRTYFEGLTYFQYLYDIDEFRRILTASGLHTIETMGYSVTWGLYDLKFLSRRAQARSRAATAAHEAAPAADKSAGGTSLIKHLVLDEQTGTLIERAATALMRKAFANMMMFVCQKR